MNRHNGMGAAAQDQVRGAYAVLDRDRNEWPYWWVYPRENTQSVPFSQSIPLPVAGVLTEVMELQVPAGFCFVLRGIRHTYQGAGFVDGSGDLLWTIDVDNPNTAVSIAGFGLPYLTNMAEQRGDQARPWPIEGYAVFNEFQTLRYKVISALGVSGAPNLVTCGLYGWFDTAL